MATRPHHLTHHLLQINLEIIYLLTGENYGPIKKELEDHVTPCSSSNLSGGVTNIEERNDKKILELAGKIIALLTNGKDLNKGAMMENPQPLPSLGGSYSPDSHFRAEEHRLQPRPANSVLEQHAAAETMEVVCYEDGNSSAISTPKQPMKFIQCKEEPRLFSEGHLPHPDIPTHLIQSAPTPIKEEDHRLGEGHLLPPHSSTPAHHHIKQESCSLGEEHGTSPDSSAPAHHIQSTPSHIKEESCSLGEEHGTPPDSSAPAHHTPSTPTLMREEEQEVIPHIEITVPEHDAGFSEGGVRSGEEPLSHSSTLGARVSNQNGQGGEMGQKSYFCTDCGKRFRYNTWFIAHQKTHIVTPAYCSECNRHFSNMEALKRHLRAHSSPKAKCPECGKFFPTKTDLRNHQLIHAKSYNCSECGITFSSNVNFLKHRRMHQGEMVYQCSQCEKCFSNPERLQRHQRIHTGERLFSCTECEQSFLDRCDLVKHMRIHTGERPFICLQCGSSFYNSSNFLRHWRAHSKNKP